MFEQLVQQFFYLLVLDLRVGVGEVEVVLVLDIFQELATVESLFHSGLQTHLVMIEFASLSDKILQNCLVICDT